MPASYKKVSRIFLSRTRSRLVLLLLIVAGITAFVVTEMTYSKSTATLRSGIALTDDRLEAAELVQLLNEVDGLQFGYLATGNEAYWARYQSLQERMDLLQQQVLEFFTAQGLNSAEAAQRIRVLFDGKMARWDQITAVVKANDAAASTALARSIPLTENLQLQQLLNTELNRAGVAQSQIRVSIYDALLQNRMVIALLTLLIIAALLVLEHYLFLNEQQREREQDRLERQVRERTMQLRELALHLHTVREEERSRLARELHDELGGLLTTCKLNLARARGKASGLTEVVTRLDSAVSCINQGIALKRQIIENLSPSALTHLGLRAALENLCRDMAASIGIPIFFNGKDLHLSANASLMSYRFVQEALTNIAKYANAKSVDVSADFHEDAVIITVRDDGVGFDSTSSRVGHHGISGMQFRAECLGGSFTLHSAPGSGTTSAMTFPYDANKAGPADSLVESMSAEV